jgi:serine protease Do
MRELVRILLFGLLATLPSLAQNPPAGQAQSRVAGLASSKESLQQLSESLETLSRSVSRAVVQIFSTGYGLVDEDSTGGDATSMGLVTKQRSSGSGVILSADGYIITNNHVVRNARRVRVQLAAPPDTAGDPGEPALHAHGQLLEAKVVGFDRDADLALLKVQTKEALTPLTLADSDLLRQGQVVLAFGNPLGLENSVSLGIVSSVGRQIHPDDPMSYIQTDAPINPGNSGGPLLDANGNVVGINTFILSQSGGSEGIGFAIPSSVVKNVYEQLRQEGHVHRGEIGVTAQSITPELAAGLELKQDAGVILGDVDPDGPAAAVGLEVGDIVISLNNRVMHNARQFDADLNRVRLKQMSDITVLRGAQKIDVTVKVIEREDDPFRFVDLVKPEDNMVPKLGIIGVPITRDIAQLLPETRKQYGVIVAARAGESEYSGQGGLKLGDVIYSVNTTPISTLDALRQSVNSLRSVDPLVLQIERDGKLMFLTLSEE